MRYVSWGVLYEGPSDALYLDVLLPRVIRNIVAQEGADLVEVPDFAAVKLGANGRSVESIAEEACRFRDAYDVVFIHADTGGRALERGLQARAGAYCEALLERCAWPLDRCITITPRHETEAWLLADDAAVREAFGFSGTAEEVGLPVGAQAAERLGDPKQVLRVVSERISGRRRTRSVDHIFPAIAQRQRIDALRGSRSFRELEDRLRQCLQKLGCVL